MSDFLRVSEVLAAFPDPTRVRLREIRERFGSTMAIASTAKKLAIDYLDSMNKEHDRMMIEAPKAPEYTPAERIILALLAGGALVTHDQIRGALYGRRPPPKANVTQVLISRIRRKLATSQIETVHGMGYRLRQVQP